MPELEGLRLSETHRIKEAMIQSVIELTHAKYQEEGLTLTEPTTTNDYILDKGFAFIITDTELEEKVDNMPLMIARVTP